MKNDLTYELLLALVRIQTKLLKGYPGIRTTSGVEPMHIKCSEVSFFKNDSAKELIGILGWHRNYKTMQAIFAGNHPRNKIDPLYPASTNIDEINNLYKFNEDPLIGISKNCSGERSIIIRMIYMIFGVNPYLNFYEDVASKDIILKKTYAKIMFEANKLNNHYENAINIRMFKNINLSEDPNINRSDFLLQNIKRQQKIIKAAIRTIQSRFLVIAAQMIVKDFPHIEAELLFFKNPSSEPSISLSHILNLWCGSIESYRNGVIRNNFPKPFEAMKDQKKKYWAVKPYEAVKWLESKNISCDLISENNSSDKDFFIFEKIFQQMGSDVSIRKAKKIYQEAIK